MNMTGICVNEVSVIGSAWLLSLRGAPYKKIVYIGKHQTKHRKV